MNLFYPYNSFPKNLYLHHLTRRNLEQGMDIKTLSEILGHADASTTLNKYAHSLPNQKRKAIDLMGKLHQSQN